MGEAAAEAISNTLQINNTLVSLRLNRKFFKSVSD